MKASGIIPIFGGKEQNPTKRTIMRKAFIMALAVAAMTFAGCKDGKTTTSGASTDSAMTDSTMTDSAATGLKKTDVTADADKLIEQLNEKLKGKDGKGVATLLASAQSKMGEMSRKNPKEAQKYISSLQQWMLDNGDELMSTLKASGDAPEIQAITQSIGAASESDRKAIADGLDKAKDKIKEAAKSATPEQMKAARKAIKDATGKMPKETREAAQKAMKDML